jgi:aldehyde:ferredoxin oxidoreductase
MKSILRANLTTLPASVEDILGANHGLGGRGLTSKIIASEVPPKCDPLCPENKLAFFPGILAGTMVPNNGRLSVGAKSPLTNGIKEANSGGAAAQKLARLGIAALVIEGKAEHPTFLQVGKDGVEFIPTSDHAGLGNYALVDRVRSEYGDKVSVISIGPAGEMLLRAAAVSVTAPDFHLRMAARGGLGAVMGSKNLKAIVVDDGKCGPMPVQDKGRLKESVVVLTKSITANGFVQGLKQLVTPLIVMVTNTVGALPTKNYSAGNFEKAESICGEYMSDVMKKRPNGRANHRCINGCVVGCPNVHTDADGEMIASGVEYETIALVGSNCMIGDLDTIARINRQCNDVGVDTMNVGGAIAVAMEKGVLPWGDGEKTLALVEEIGAGTAMAQMIGSGCKVARDKLGVKRVPHVKGQCLSGYDPGILKGTGVTFATSPMGADHTAGIVLPGLPDPDYVPVASVVQDPKSQFIQAFMAAFDALGFCMMTGMPVYETTGLEKHLIDCVSVITGENLDYDYLRTLGESILRTERGFNDAVGFTRDDDRLPQFFSDESLVSGGPVFDVPEDEIDKVNRFGD